MQEILKHSTRGPPASEEEVEESVLAYHEEMMDTVLLERPMWDPCGSHGNHWSSAAVLALYREMCEARA